MKITNFKQGDIIWLNDGKQGAWQLKQPFELVGYTDSAIVLIKWDDCGIMSHHVIGSMGVVTFRRNEHETGWELYPFELMSQAKERLIYYAKALVGLRKVDDYDKSEEIKSGTLVKTCDGRYGFVKKVDEHAVAFIGKKDYQIQFPDGIGIFRKDEFTIEKNPPVN